MGNADGGMIGNVLGSIAGQFAEGPGYNVGPEGAGPWEGEWINPYTGKSDWVGRGKGPPGSPNYTWADYLRDVEFSRGAGALPAVSPETRRVRPWEIPAWFLQWPYAQGADYLGQTELLGPAYSPGEVPKAGNPPLSSLAVRSLAKLFPSLAGQMAVNIPEWEAAPPIHAGGSPWWFVQGNKATTAPPTPMPEEASAQAMRNIRTSGGLPAFRGYMEGPQKTPWEAYLAQIQGAWPAAQKKRPATRRPARQQ